MKIVTFINKEFDYDECFKVRIIANDMKEAVKIFKKDALKYFGTYDRNSMTEDLMRLESIEGFDFGSLNLKLIDDKLIANEFIFNCYELNTLLITIENLEPRVMDVEFATG